MVVLQGLQRLLVPQHRNVHTFRQLLQVAGEARGATLTLLIQQHQRDSHKPGCGVPVLALDPIREGALLAGRQYDGGSARNGHEQGVGLDA